MDKKDILELKRRLKKEECTFTKLRGCYVDGHKNTILHINETFLNLEEDEYYKYLEIARKVLSGTIGNNLLSLSFAKEEEESGGKQQFMLGLRESKLKNDDLLERFYELIIDNYEYAGNYLILLFHDAYDVITKTTDNGKLDESEEVYEYLLCAICPVELSKPGLGYHKEENRIGARNRDWIVLPPETGFIFPAFSQRSSDIHSVMYFTKNAKQPQPEFMDAALGCMPVRTAVEEKTTFHTIVKNIAKDDTELVLMEMQETMNAMVLEHKNIFENEPVVLNNQTLQAIITESNIPAEVAGEIEKYCAEEFGDTPPVIENLIDTKALEENARKKKEQHLQKEVMQLRQELTETNSNQKEKPANNPNDIILEVNPEKVPEITCQMIDGRKYILIPIEDEEQTKINGLAASI